MKLSVKFGLMLIVAASQGSMSYAASFDCDKAASPVEKMICSDSQLSELDSRLAETYSAARTRAADSDSLKHDQRDWLKSIRKECQEVACFKDAYAARISALTSNQPVASSPGAQPVLTSPDAVVKSDVTPESQPAPKSQSGKHAVKESAATQPTATPVAETPPADGKSSKGIALLGGLLLVGLWYLFKSRRKPKTELPIASTPTPVAPVVRVMPAEVKPAQQSSMSSGDQEIQARYLKMMNEQLLAAVASGDSKKANELISKGASVNVPDEHGFTPLHMAAMKDDVKAVIALLKNGADANAKNNSGMTALQLAEKSGLEAASVGVLLGFMATGKVPEYQHEISRAELGNQNSKNSESKDEKMTTQATALNKIEAIKFTADKFTYVVFAQIKDDFGATLTGIGAHPLYIFQNTASEEITGLVGDELLEVKAFSNKEGAISEIIDQYLDYVGLEDFRAVTGMDVDKDYLIALVISALEKDASDFEYENDAQTVLLDGDSGITDEDVLNHYVDRFGVWVMTRENCDINFDVNKPVLLINDDSYDSLSSTFDVLWGESEQAVLLLSETLHGEMSSQSDSDNEEKIAHNYQVHQFPDEIIEGMRSGTLDGGTGLEISRYLRADQNGEFHTAIVYTLEDSDEAAPRMRGAYYGAVGGGDCDGGFFEIEPEEGSCQLLSFDDAESSDDSVVFDALMFECARFYNNDDGTYELTDYAQETLADAEDVGDDRVFMDNDFDVDSLEDIAQQWNLRINFNCDSDSNDDDEESSESDLLSASREEVLQAVSDEGWQLDNVSDEFKDDKEIVLAAVNESGYALQFASEAMRNDKEVVLVAVSNRGSALGSASDDLRNDREVVLAAINSDGDALEHAAERFKKDATIVELAVSQSGRALQYAAEQFHNDLKTVMLAVGNSGSALEYASEALRNNRDVVLAAINNDGAALQYSTETLCSDKEIVQTAISNDGRAIEHASENLRGDKILALEAVSNMGCALEYVSEDLQNDEEVVLAAVSQDGYALQYASDELKNDRDVVLTAVNESGRALEYASDELRADQEVVDAAVENDEDARDYSLMDGPTGAELLARVDGFSSPSDVSNELEDVISEAAKLNEDGLLQEIYDRASKVVGSNYVANIKLWYLLTTVLGEKEKAEGLYYSTKLDDPEEMDDVYHEAANLLEAFGQTEDEVENLKRDAEAMFDEDGSYIPDWMEKL